VKPASSYATLDRSAPETQRHQLRASDHAVLSLGEPGDPDVDRHRVELTIHLMDESTRLGSSPPRGT